MSLFDHGKAGSQPPEKLSLSVHVTHRCAAKLISFSPSFVDPPNGSYKVGFLLGTADRKRITVQDAVIVDCPGTEDTFLPQGCLDDAFQKGCTAAVEDPAFTWLEALGWFIFHHAEDPELNPSEIQFHNRHFSQRAGLILILRLTASRELLARAISALPNMPLARANQLRASATINVANPRRPMRLFLRETVTDESYARAYQVVGSLDREERWQEWKEIAQSILQRRQLLFAIGLSAVLLCIAALWIVGSVSSSQVIRYSSPARSSLHADLGLHVESLGDTLMVTWNRGSPVVLAARTGVLHVEDGTDQRDISLNHAQIANGVVLYRPQSAPVSFQLVFDDGAGGSWVDSIASTASGVVK